MPAVAQGLVGLALLLALAPSALHIPVTGPGGQAEVAPLPGQSHAQASLSQLGAASSGGVGAGGSSAQANGADNPPATAGGRPAPSAFGCVGSPARQTPDPLSPPCVAGWSGDNGGATAPGVTGQAIKVIYYVGADIYSGNQTLVDNNQDFTAPVAQSDDRFLRTVKTLLRYFQTHFETYGRTVELIGQGNYGEPDSQDAANAVQQKPFAVINMVGTTTYTADLAHAQVITFPSLYGTAYSSAFLQSYSPYVWSFQPTPELEERASATWICRQLAGGLAKHSNDLNLQRKPRKFGIVFTKDSSRPDLAVDARLLQSDLNAACGLQIADVLGDEFGDSSAGAAMGQLSSHGVTSVICFCEGGPSTTQEQSTEVQAASQMTPPYQPEWIFDADSEVGQTTTARDEPQTEWSGAFGLTWQWRVPALPNTYWYQAYSEMNSDGQFDPYLGPILYEDLMRVFTAIQRAGPRLNVATVQAGLESFSRPSPGPDSPYGAYSPADHSFLKDQMLMRWNPTGTPPGGAVPDASGNSSGCYTQVADGRRFTADAWPDGDHAGDPGTCGGDFTSGSAVNSFS